MNNYFLGPDRTIEKRLAPHRNLTTRPTDKNYIYIEFFADYSLVDVHKCLTDDELKQIRDGNTILVLSNTYEAFHHIVEPIYNEVVIKLSIPPGNIILMSESADIDQEVNRIAAKYNLPELQCEWSRIYEYYITKYRATGNFPMLIFGNTFSIIFGLSMFSLFRMTYLILTSTVIVEAYVKLRVFASCGNINFVAPLFS